VLVKPVEAGIRAHQRAPGESRKRIALFLVLTFALSAVAQALIMGMGRAPLLDFAIMWSPGITALITTYAFQGNVRDMGWRLGKPHYLLLGYGLPLTGETGITEYVVGEFGVASVLTGIVIAYVFWRLRHRIGQSRTYGI
jgi:hypothetical protein